MAVNEVKENSSIRPSELTTILNMKSFIATQIVQSEGLVSANMLKDKFDVSIYLARATLQSFYDEQHFNKKIRARFHYFGAKMKTCENIFEMRVDEEFLDQVSKTHDFITKQRVDVLCHASVDPGEVRDHWINGLETQSMAGSPTITIGSSSKHQTDSPLDSKISRIVCMVHDYASRASSQGSQANTQTRPKLAIDAWLEYRDLEKELKDYDELVKSREVELAILTQQAETLKMRNEQLRGQAKLFKALSTSKHTETAINVRLQEIGKTVSHMAAVDRFLRGEIK